MAEAQHERSVVGFWQTLLAYFVSNPNRRNGTQSLADHHGRNQKMGHASGHDEKSELCQPVHEFRTYIESDAGMMELFSQAFREIPDDIQSEPDEDGRPRIHDYVSMIDAIDRAVKMAPIWKSTLRSNCVIGCPMNEALIWLMNTRTGSRIFLRKDVNAHFAVILSAWAKHLSSAASLSVINDESGGWLSGDAQRELLHEVNGAYNAPSPASCFEEVFICQPSEPSYGFKSWDDFFTRRWQPGVRPIACPEDHGIIVNPCESQPLLITANVAAKCDFSLKGTSYSLLDMLQNDPYAERFVGGTVYQGWLSLYNYHRWHAPVSGQVARVLHIKGTYFAADPFKGFENLDPSTSRPVPDRQAPDASQIYISSIATRTVVLIQADDARVGMVGFVAIGMSEVSSCVAIVTAGQHVEKGQEIGSFHYGGSSYCLLFEPGVKLLLSSVVREALDRPAEIGGRCIAVNSELARLVQSE